MIRQLLFGAAVRRLQESTADPIFKGHNPATAAKRGDLAVVHRRLDSIARYWQPFKVVSVTREGHVKDVEDNRQTRTPVDRMLRVDGSGIQLVDQAKVNVSAVLSAWGAEEFTAWETIEQVRAGITPFLIT